MEPEDADEDIGVRADEVHEEVPERVQVEVQADVPAEGMGDTHDQGFTKPLVFSEGTFFNVSVLLGPWLAPQSSGRGIPIGGFCIREGGSAGGLGTVLRFSLGDR